MKKLIIFGMMCLMTLTVQAQRIAVVGFKAGARVSLADIDGISETFSTYFRPQGYSLVDRQYIDKALAEQRLQYSTITETQAVSLGKYMNMSKIVVGKVYISFDGGYQVDVSVLDVQSGLRVAEAGKTVTSGSYRQTIEALAKQLAGKIAITPGSTISAQPQQATPYVDLGLPSGTLWKSANEKGSFVTYDEAMQRYGNNLPTREQWEELKGMCTGTWTGKGFKVTGPNGNSIVLPASGSRDCYGDVSNVGDVGLYWSSTPKGSDRAWGLYSVWNGWNKGYVTDYSRCNGFSVRLVQNP